MQAAVAVGRELKEMLRMASIRGVTIQQSFDHFDDKVGPPFATTTTIIIIIIITIIIVIIIIRLYLTRGAVGGVAIALNTHRVSGRDTPP
jgi:hypothetical protein